MSLIKYGSQSFDRNVRISLRGGQGCMAEKFLHRSQIGSTLKDVRCRGVSQCMRCYRLHASVISKCAHNPSHRALIDATPASTNEQRTLPRPRWNLRTNIKPGRKCTCGGLAERYDALLAPLAKHPEPPIGQIDIGNVRSAELTDAAPRCVQDFNDRLIPECNR